MIAATDHVVVQAVEPVVEQRQGAQTDSDLARLLDGDVVARLTKDAQQAGIPLSGEGGLLQQLTKVVLETALQGDMDAHLGTASTSRPGARAGTRGTAPGPRRWSLTWARWRSRCPAT